MATIIELKTPPKHAAKGRDFRDYTLDVDSIHDNCRRIAAELSKATGRKVTDQEVLAASKTAIMGLGNVTASHKAYMHGLGGRRP